MSTVVELVELAMQAVAEPDNKTADAGASEKADPVPQDAETEKAKKRAER